MHRRRGSVETDNIIVADIQRCGIGHRAIHNPTLGVIFSSNEILYFPVERFLRQLKFKNNQVYQCHSRFRRNMARRQFRFPISTQVCY